MIVPRYRLLFWTALIFPPCGALFFAAPGMAAVSAILMALMSLAAAGDALMSTGRLDGADVAHPDVVRFSKNREGVMALRVHGLAPGVRELRMGLVLPPGLDAPPEQTAPVGSPADPVILSWSLTAARQGVYAIPACVMETPSVLGFWAVRRKRRLDADIRVYPDLFSERKRLAGLFSRNAVGARPQRQVGKGREFDQLREYLPGDSYEDIHWKATARFGAPVTKMYQIERTQQIYLAVDASRLSARRAERTEAGPFAETILDRYVTAALILGLAAERQGDRFGLLAFNDRVRSFMKAGAGRAHFNACRDMLCALRPDVATPDFEELFTFIGTRLRRRALMIFLTNMDDPVLAESFVRSVEIISRRHMVLVSMIKPERADPIFSNDAVDGAEDIYRNLGGHFLWAGLAAAEKQLKRRGAAFSMVEHERLCPELVSRYLAVKQRQAL